MKIKKEKTNPTGAGGAKKNLHKDTITKPYQYSKSLNPIKTKEWCVPHLAASLFDCATSSYAQFAQEIWSVNGEGMKCK